MDETEVAVKFEAHEHEISSLEYRINNLEKQNEDIQTLTVSVNKVTFNIKDILKQLDGQGKRLEALEGGPKETNYLLKAAIITALVGGIIGTIMSAIMITI